MVRSPNIYTCIYICLTIRSNSEERTSCIREKKYSRPTLFPSHFLRMRAWVDRRCVGVLCVWMVVVAARAGPVSRNIPGFGMDLSLLGFLCKYLGNGLVGVVYLFWCTYDMAWSKLDRIFAVVGICTILTILSPKFRSALFLCMNVTSIVGASTSHIPIRAPWGQVCGHSARFASGLNSFFILMHLLYIFIYGLSFDESIVYDVSNIVGIAFQCSVAFRWGRASKRVAKTFERAGLLAAPRGSNKISCADLLQSYTGIVRFVLAPLFPFSIIWAAQLWHTKRLSDRSQNRSKDSRLISRVIRIPDIIYRSKKGRTMTVDIWHDPSALFESSKTKPIFLYWHGGSWSFGSKTYNHSAALFWLLAKQGFIVVSASYCKAPQYRWKDIIEDATCALDWTVGRGLESHLHNLGASLEPSLFLGGSSAGGHIAACVAASSAASVVRIRGVACWYPPLDLRDITGVVASLPFDVPLLKYRRAQPLLQWFFSWWVLQNDSEELGKKECCAPEEIWSPIEQITDRFPPVIIIHGDMDATVPIEASRNFVNKTNRRDDLLISVPGRRHAFDAFFDGCTTACLDGVSSWLHRQIKRE